MGARFAPSAPPGGVKPRPVCECPECEPDLPRPRPLPKKKEAKR